MSQKVGTKLCSSKGCRSQFSDNGNHNCCPSHSSCYDNDLAEYQPSNCEQCQRWISLLRKAPTEAMREVSRDKLSSWVAKLQNLRRERHLPGKVIQDRVLCNLIFDFDAALSDDVFGQDSEEQCPGRGSQKLKRSIRSRVIVSDDDSEEDEPPEKRCISRSSSESTNEPIETIPVPSAETDRSVRADLPSMEEVTKTMNWLVQSVADIQHALLQRKLVDSDKWEQSNEATSSKDYEAVSDPNEYQIANPIDPVTKCETLTVDVTNDNLLLPRGCAPQEHSEVESCHSEGQGEVRGQEDIPYNVWVPLPEEFKLDRSGPEPRVKVPVGNSWMTLSCDRCKVQFRSTIPFIKYVIDIHKDESVTFVNSVPESDKVKEAFTDFATFVIENSDGMISQKSNCPIGSRDYKDNWLVLPVRDGDILAEGYFNDFSSLWAKYMEGKDSKLSSSLSFLNVVFDRENMTELHAALSAPQIEVDDTKRLLQVELRKLPVASYKEDKCARAQLLRLMNGIQSLQSLIASLKATLKNWGETESSIVEGFFKAFEAPMLTLEGAFRFTLMEFFRIRKSLRKRLFHGLKLNLQISDLMRSSPFSEGLFQPSAVKEFLSQLKRQHMSPTDVIQKRKKQKKVIFSKKHFALPKRKCGNHVSQKLQSRKIQLGSPSRNSYFKGGKVKTVKAEQDSWREISSPEGSQGERKEVNVHLSSDESQQSC